MNARRDIRTGDRVQFSDRRAPDYRRVANTLRVPYQPRHSIARPLFGLACTLALIGFALYLGFGGAL